MNADAVARTLAADWANGGDPLGVLASTGRIEPETHLHIVTLAGLEGLQFDGADNARELYALARYVENRGPRPDVPGWDTIETLDGMGWTEEYLEALETL